MATMSINSTTFTGLAAKAATLAAGNYYSTGGKYGQPPVAKEPEYDDIYIHHRGVDGRARDRGGFIGRNITANIIFASSTLAVHATAKSALEGFAQLNRFTISMPDGTSYPNCVFVGSTTPYFDNMDGKILLIYPCTFRQESL